MSNFGDLVREVAASFEASEEDEHGRIAREAWWSVGPGQYPVPRATPWDALSDGARAPWIAAAKAVLEHAASRTEATVRVTAVEEKFCICDHAERHHAAFHDSVPDCSQCWCTGWRDRPEMRTGELEFPDEWPFRPGDVLEVKLDRPEWIRGVVRQVKVGSFAGPELSISYDDGGYPARLTFSYRQVKIREPEFDDMSVEEFRRRIIEGVPVQVVTKKPTGEEN